MALQWGDLDWNHNQMHVRRSIWKGQFVTPKSKISSRKIDMSPYLVTELRKHKFSNLKLFNGQDLVFCNSEGKPIDPDSLIKRQFLPALTRANIRQIRFRDLRHTRVALRIEQGQNIKYIQN